jgi:hypothetical protein
MKGRGLDLVPITVVSESHRVQPWGGRPRNLTIYVILWHFNFFVFILGCMKCNHSIIIITFLYFLFNYPPSYPRITSAPNLPWHFFLSWCAFIIYRPCTTHSLSGLVQGQGRFRNQRSWFLLFCKERSDLQNPFCNELQWTKWNLQKLQKHR